MRMLVVALVLLVAAPLRADVTAPSPGAIRWRSDAAAAEREANKGQRPLLVFFSAEWCMPCKEMLRTSFADAAVAALIERRFVPLFVDVTDDNDTAAALRDRFAVVALPTVVVRRGSAERLRLDRLLPPAELRAALEHVAK